MSSSVAILSAFPSTPGTRLATAKQNKNIYKQRNTRQNKANQKGSKASASRSRFDPRQPNTMSTTMELPEDDNTGIQEGGMPPTDLLPPPLVPSTTVTSNSRKRIASSRGPKKKHAKRGPFKLLELFSGTGSIGTAFKDIGWTCASLDITGSPFHKPDIKMDIRDWNYKKIDPGTFDAIWASPPCTEYSNARTTPNAARDYELADSLVIATRDYELVDNLKFNIGFRRHVVDYLKLNIGFRRHVVDYCWYGTCYHKHTLIWCNFPASWVPLTCKYDCEACDKVKKMHLRSAQRGDGWTVHDLNRIPSKLCASLAVACNKEMKS